MRRATVKRSPVPSKFRKEGIVDTGSSKRSDYIRNLGRDSRRQYPHITYRSRKLFGPASSRKTLNRESRTACWCQLVPSMRRFHIHMVRALGTVSTSALSGHLDIGTVNQTRLAIEKMRKSIYASEVICVLE